jgi:peptidoglycan hydrolase-like amidase
LAAIYGFNPKQIFLHSKPQASTPSPPRLMVSASLFKFLQRYVAYVLSAEAAPNEPPASFEALAFVARTFALANTHRHRIEGFDLCDSTHCQALHFGPIRPAIAQAIRHTAGISLWNGSNRASVYYTQNCGGISEAASALWPVEHAPYLISHTNPYCLRRSPADWHANVSLADLDRIASEQNWQLPAPITGIRITQHTPSGRAKRLEISSPAHTAAISASSLRFTGQGYGHGVGLCQSGAFQMAREHHTAAGRLFMLNWSRKNRRIRYQRWCFQSWNFSSHVRSSTLSFGPQVLLTKRVQVLQPRQKLRRILHAIHAELQFIYTL